MHGAPSVWVSAHTFLRSDGVWVHTWSRFVIGPYPIIGGPCPSGSSQFDLQMLYPMPPIYRSSEGDTAAVRRLTLSAVGLRDHMLTPLEAIHTTGALCGHRGPTLEWTSLVTLKSSLHASGFSRAWKGGPPHNFTADNE